MLQTDYLRNEVRAIAGRRYAGPTMASPGRPVDDMWWVLLGARRCWCLSVCEGPQL